MKSSNPMDQRRQQMRLMVSAVDQQNIQSRAQDVLTATLDRIAERGETLPTPAEAGALLRRIEGEIAAEVAEGKKMLRAQMGPRIEAYIARKRRFRRLKRLGVAAAVLAGLAALLFALGGCRKPSRPCPAGQIYTSSGCITPD